MTERRETAAGVGRVVLLALATQQLIMAYDATAMNVAISDIIKDLDTTLTGVQTAISLYALVMASLMITGSKLGTRYGHTRMFTLGAVIYGTGALITSLSPSLPVMLIGWTLLEGIGAALIFPAILSISTNMFTGTARTRALAIIGASIGAGAALGPLVGGLITTYLTWRVSFLMETLITAGVIVVMRRALEPKHDRPEQPFDFVGVVLSALGFGLIVLATLLISKYGLVTAQQDVAVFDRTILHEGDISPSVLLGAAGLVILTIFAWWEHHRIARGKDPLVRLAILRDRATRVGSFTFGIYYLVTAGMLFLVPVFVQTTLGYTALESGLTLLPTTAMLILAAMAAPRLVSGGRASRKQIVFVGFLLMAAGAAIVALTFDPDASGLSLAPGLAVAGLGLGLCAIVPDIVQSAAPPDAVSDVAGMSNSVAYLGQSLGVALAGALMVGVLVQSFTIGVQDSTVFTGQQKTTVEQTVETQVQATAVSDDQLEAALRAQGISGVPAAEIVRINATARENGLTAGVAGMAIFALLGCVLALRLPRRAGS